MLGDGVKAAREAMDDPRAVLLPVRFRAAFSLLLDDVRDLMDRVASLEGSGGLEWSREGQDPAETGWYLCRRRGNEWGDGCRWRYWFGRWWRIEGHDGYPVHDALAVGWYLFKPGSREDALGGYSTNFTLRYGDLEMGKSGDK